MSPSNITVLHSFKGEVALRALQEALQKSLEDFCKDAQVSWSHIKDYQHPSLNSKTHYTFEEIKMCPCASLGASWGREYLTSQARALGLMNNVSACVAGWPCWYPSSPHWHLDRTSSSSAAHIPKHYMGSCVGYHRVNQYQLGIKQSQWRIFVAPMTN